MRVIKKSEITNELITPRGEIIYELIGKSELTGGTAKHSLAREKPTWNFWRSVPRPGCRKIRLK
jgi:hypothetical protein